MRAVGYKLAQANKKVFIILFKEISKLDKKDEIIAHLKNIKGYLFLDDIHLNKEESKYFLRIKERILFSSRQPKERKAEDRTNIKKHMPETEEYIDVIDKNLKRGRAIKSDNNIKGNIIDRFNEISGCSFSEEVRKRTS